MKIVHYVQWNNPGERNIFNRLVKQSKDNAELKELLMNTFNIQLHEANVVVLRFIKEIKEIRSKQN